MRRHFQADAPKMNSRRGAHIQWVPSGGGTGWMGPGPSGEVYLLRRAGGDRWNLHVNGRIYGPFDSLDEAKAEAELHDQHDRSASKSALLHERGGRRVAADRPEIEEIGHIGDVNWPEHGGGPVYCRVPESGDQTDIYGDCFLVYCEPPTDDVEFDDPEARWTLYSVELDPEVPSWGDLNAVARTNDQDPKELRAAFASTNPMQRAWAYETWAGHYGWLEFDQYARELTCAEMNRQYNADIDCGGNDEEDLDEPGPHHALEARRGRRAPEPNADSIDRLASYIAHAVMYDVSTSQHDLMSAYHLTSEEANRVLVNRGGWFGPGGEGFGAFKTHIKKTLKGKQWFSAPDPKAIPGAARAYGRYVWLLENAAPPNTDQGRKDLSDTEDLQRELTNVGFNGWGLFIDNWPEAAGYYSAAPSVYRRGSRT